MGTNDEEWLEPDEQMGLWEHQGSSLTVRWLAVALAEAAEGVAREALNSLLAHLDVAGDLPVEVEYFDGTTAKRLHPMHIDVRATEGKPSAIVITVA